MSRLIFQFVRQVPQLEDVWGRKDTALRILNCGHSSSSFSLLLPKQLSPVSDGQKYFGPTEQARRYGEVSLVI